MPTLLQSAASNNSSPGSVSSANLTYALAVSAGSLVVCVFSCYQTVSATLGVSDNVNSTSWINAIQVDNSNANLAIFYYPNSIAGTMQVTCTQSGSAQPMRFGLQEWSGIALINPLDKVIAATPGSSTTPSSGNTASTTQANELVIGGISGASGTPTITAGGAAMLDFQTVGRLGIEYQIVTSPGPQSAAFNYASADLAAVVCATFKAASAAASSYSLGGNLEF
jgi:hypothetical protein